MVFYSSVKIAIIYLMCYCQRGIWFFFNVPYSVQEFDPKYINNQEMHFNIYYVFYSQD